MTFVQTCRYHNLIVIIMHAQLACAVYSGLAKSDMCIDPLSNFYAGDDQYVHAHC